MPRGRGRGDFEGGELSNRAYRRRGRGGRGRGYHGRFGNRHHDRRPFHTGGFGEHAMNETKYFFENGLRKVRPYFFTFSTYAKRRWVGRTILDVYSEEFLQLTREEYKLFIEAGSLKVNDSTISPDYVIKDGDFIHHTMHRHENPVADEPIEIIEMDEDIVVVNKPSSIPVHPCGSYRHNSVIFILGHEHKLFNLRTIYRLDRLTSGVLVLGRSHRRTLQLEKQIKEKQILKEYVCRVVGEFPSERVECTESMDILSPKLGIHRVCAQGEGKESMTIFERMWYNGKTSVVRCKPLTGRTHQIRVHLQFLGHPIINDPIYNSPAFGPVRGKGGEYGKTLEQLENDIKEHHSREKFKIDFSEIVSGLKNDGDSSGDLSAQTNNGADYWTKDDAVTTGVKRGCEVDAEEEPQQKQIKTEVEESEADGAAGPSGEAQCKDCRVQYKDPSPSDLVMYLHAYKYQGPDWEYGTDMPEWARRDWSDPSGEAS
ncbi:pseudouridylate synthase RPUSD2-like [Lineus longissimus]|uniref:pseudouridylate synthase RPUSD2-like n=1 Tax=Lineus longissimus TaxID=88925 RepID=UPI00315CB0C4